MSFFSYKPQEASAEASPPPHPEGQKIPPEMVIIEGANLIKVIADNTEIPEGKTDIGNGFHRVWNPLNYDPKTGEILK